MSDKLSSHLLSLLGESWFSASECLSGWGIPDLVLVRVDREGLTRRMRAALRPLTHYSLCVVLANMEVAGPTDVSILQERTGFSRDYLKYSLLKRLAADGYVRRQGKEYTVNPEWSCPIEEVVAVEMKLSDWRRGCLQAWRYLGFAERTYLAMAVQGPSRARVLTALSKTEIGLIFVSPEEVTIAHQAREAGPDSPPDRLFVSEQVLSRLWKDLLPDT